MDGFPALSKQVMDGVLIATGFTGAIWSGWMWRNALRYFRGTAEVKAFFSPKGGCQEAIVRELKAARKEILVQAYSFTADSVTFGLVEAQKRGVQVDIILDRSNEAEAYSDLKILVEKGLTPLIDAKHAIAHNKIILIDQKILITGSYNFTNQAEHDNAENLVILKGHPELVQEYRKNFHAHKAHAQAPGTRLAEPNRQAA